MAFLRNRNGSAKLSTIGYDDKDFVMAGIKYNVVFLGSILVPTPTGHGSSRTENAVEKVYNEKYKAFGYGSRKVSLEISVDELKILENAGRNENVVAKFQTTDVTYYNGDLKHDKAFVFVVNDQKDKSYRAYVFHCDSAARLREILHKIKKAFQIKETKTEEMRLRAFSAPSKDLRERFQAKTKGGGDQMEGNDEDWGVFKSVTNERKHEDVDNFFLANGRQRSQTEIHTVNNLLLTGLEGQNSKRTGNLIDEHRRDSANFLQPGDNGLESFDDDEDDFTKLAEKRLRSFDDHAMKGTGESLLLLNDDTGDQSSIFGSKNSRVVKKSAFENENLLQF